jgi:hypothetical protein
MSSAAFAQPELTLAPEQTVATAVNMGFNSADTAWMLIATVLVLLMTLPMRKTLGVVALFVVSNTAYAAVGDQFGSPEINQPEKVQAGKVVFVDPQLSKLIELDLSGKVTWEYSIPFAWRGKLTSGTDVEWLPASDNFLLAIPESGVFEINRQSQVVWQYKTRFVSHDADRLPNGNTVFVNGWDADTDPIVTEVDSSGKVVFQLFAQKLGLDLSERRTNPAEPHSNTHTNAVHWIAEGEYLISLRNFHQFIKIKNGEVVETFKKARNVHDPLPFEDGYLFAIHFRDRSELIFQNVSGKRKPLFVPEPETWTPLRTVELLRNNNILVTGSREVGQLDQDGKLVWSLKMNQYDSQITSTKKTKNFIYKAAFVYR